MMQIRKRHWLLAIGAASAAHLTLAALFQQPPSPGAQATGMGGVEISLGPAGGAAGAVEDVMPTEVTAAAVPEVEPAVAEVEVESARPVETKTVAEPVVEAERKVDPEPIAEPETVEPEAVAAVPATPVDVAEPPEKEVEAEPVEEPKVVARAAPPEAAPSTTPDHVSDASTNTPAPRGTAARGEAGQQNAQHSGSGDHSADGGDPGARADYFAKLQAWLERHRRYPRRAQMRRQEGTALLYFVIDRNGRVLDYRIERSSGYSVLDREVKAMLERAEPLPPVPPQLRQARLELLLPIEFAIR